MLVSLLAFPFSTNLSSGAYWHFSWFIQSFLFSPLNHFLIKLHPTVFLIPCRLAHLNPKPFHLSWFFSLSTDSIKSLLKISTYLITSLAFCLAAILWDIPHSWVYGSYCNLIPLLYSASILTTQWQRKTFLLFPSSLTSLD